MPDRSDLGLPRNFSGYYFLPQVFAAKVIGQFGGISPFNHLVNLIKICANFLLSVRGFFLNTFFHYFCILVFKYDFVNDISYYLFIKVIKIKRYRECLSIDNGE